jgi:hypothetical protein
VIQNLNNIYLPTTDEELVTLATGWTIKSTADGCYHGLVLALDGFFCPPERNHVRMTVVILRVHAMNVHAAVESFYDSDRLLARQF